MRWLFILFTILMIGCKSTEIVPTTNQSKLVSMRYDPATGQFYDDLWDQFVNGVESGMVTFTLPKAIIIYLISNVKVFDCRPEELDLSIDDRIAISIIIFRWSW